MPNASRNFLDRIALFAGLSNTRKLDLADKCVWTELRKNEVVVAHDDPSNDVFLVVSGSVNARTYSKEGKEVNFAEIGNGEIFGEFSAIDQMQRSASVVASRETIVGRMRGSDFRDLIASEPGFSLRLCEHLVSKNRSLSRRLYEQSTLNVSQRICAELLRIAKPDKKDPHAAPIASLPTRQGLANALGTHREAISREFSRLAALGVIEVDGKKVKVLNLAALQSAAGR